MAAERQLPAITGYRLQTQGAAADLASGATMALPPPGAQATAIMPFEPGFGFLTKEEWRLDDERKGAKRKIRRLLMRPPTVLELPLRGYGCDVASWSGEWPR